MEPTYLELNESVGDIFDAEPNSILVHSCNCRGSWSAGIAKQFKDRYYEAYEEYRLNCIASDESLLGTSQIIEFITDTKKYFIGCLFVSYSYGRSKDSEGDMLSNTRQAVEDLLFKVSEHNANNIYENTIQEIRMCRINSGLFGIPWKSTKKVLESIVVNNYSIKSINILELK